jgi:hypothetical protein
MVERSRRGSSLFIICLLPRGVGLAFANLNVRRFKACFSLRFLQIMLFRGPSSTVFATTRYMHQRIIESICLPYGTLGPDAQERCCIYYLWPPAEVRGLT